LAGLHHHRAEFAAASALSREFGRQLHDRLGRRRYGLIGLGSKFGFAERWSATSFFHVRAIIRRAARLVVP
jgi:hypothetical protein